MRKIYSCIDVGSHSLKLVVIEKVDNEFVVLSRSIIKGKGIKKNKIVRADVLNPRFKIYETVLRDVVGTKVQISKNKISIPFDSDKDLNFNDVFKRADYAMYENKRKISLM